MAYQFGLPQGAAGGSLTGLPPARRAYLMAQWRKRQPAPLTAPPKPSPPAAPAPPPVDPVYDQQIGALQKSRDDTLAGLAGQQATTLTNYGYGASFDDKGAVSGLTFDPNNPFSRAALLRKSYQQSKSATTNSLASRGQLYAGAMQQAQDFNDINYQRGEDDLQRQLIAALGGVAAGRRSAQTDYELGAGAAAGDRVGRSPGNPLYEPVPPVPSKPPASKPSAAVIARVKKRWLADGRRS